MKRILTVVLVVLAAGAAGYYFLSVWQKKDAVAINNKAGELSQFLLGKDCTRVISEATEFLKKYPKAEKIWSLKGACEFELQKFSEAKDSFNRVLALDSENISAKTYLKYINPPQVEVAKYGDKIPAELPNGFPVGNIERVFQSESVKNGKSYVAFSYMTRDSKSVLLSKFSEYLKTAGYTIDPKAIVSGSSTRILAKASGRDFSIAVSDYPKENERLVDVYYSYSQNQ